jgi:hypothetical protein
VAGLIIVAHPLTAFRNHDLAVPPTFEELQKPNRQSVAFHPESKPRDFGSQFHLSNPERETPTERTKPNHRFSSQSGQTTVRPPSDRA